MQSRMKGRSFLVDRTTDTDRGVASMATVTSASFRGQATSGRGPGGSTGGMEGAGDPNR